MTITARRTYEDIVEKLQELNDQQLIAIHTIIIGLVNNQFISPLDIKSDEQLWKHIDHSLTQADAGIGEDADIVIAELMQELVV